MHQLFVEENDDDDGRDFDYDKDVVEMHYAVLQAAAARGGFNMYNPPPLCIYRSWPSDPPIPLGWEVMWQ